MGSWVSGLVMMNDEEFTVKWLRYSVFQWENTLIGQTFSGCAESMFSTCFVIGSSIKTQSTILQICHMCKDIIYIYTILYIYMPVLCPELLDSFSSSQLNVKFDGDENLDSSSSSELNVKFREGRNLDSSIFFFIFTIECSSSSPLNVSGRKKPRHCTYIYIYTHKCSKCIFKYMK